MSAAPWPRSKGTPTAGGIIPHLRVVMRGQRFLAPVRVVQRDKRLYPVRRQGQLVYVLPGGKHEVLA